MNAFTLMMLPYAHYDHKQKLHSTARMMSMGANSFGFAGQETETQMMQKVMAGMSLSL
jgi:hypothetical protein